MIGTYGNIYFPNKDNKSHKSPGGKAMIDKAENLGKESGANCIQLDVRETQDAAIKLFISKGYIQWGTNPNYAQINGKYIKGLYFYKKLT